MHTYYHANVVWGYTQATSICRIQLELETSLDKVLIEENGYSLVEIKNAV